MLQHFPEPGTGEGEGDHPGLVREEKDALHLIVADRSRRDDVVQPHCAGIDQGNVRASARPHRIGHQGPERRLPVAGQRVARVDRGLRRRHYALRSEPRPQAVRPRLHHLRHRTVLGEPGVDGDQSDRLPPVALAVAPQRGELRGPGVGVRLEHVPAGDHRVVRLVLVPAQDQIDARIAGEQVAVRLEGLVGEPHDEIAPSTP